MGDLWRGLKAIRQEKRASNRKSSRELMHEAGLQFEARNGDAHLIVKAADVMIDFWPGTGLWIVRGQPTRRYGVRGLIQFCQRASGGGAPCR